MFVSFLNEEVSFCIFMQVIKCEFKNVISNKRVKLDSDTKTTVRILLSNYSLSEGAGSLKRITILKELL